MKLEEQIAELLRLIKEDLAYCKCILSYPKKFSGHSYDPTQVFDRFYYVVCNNCFHCALLAFSSLLDRRDKRPITFWKWTEFVRYRCTELKEVCDRFENSRLSSMRDKMVAHVDAGYSANTFPIDRHRGIIGEVYIIELDNFLDKLIKLFHEHAKQYSTPYVQSYFDAPRAEEEIESVMNLAKPQLYKLPA